MDRSVVVDAVSEICRSRSVTHVVMSPETFEAYSSGITDRHLKAGIKYATCHSCGIVIIDGLRDDMIFAFNFRRAKAAQEILRLARNELYEEALDLFDEVLAKPSKWLHTGSTPWAPEEGDDNEAARE